MIPIHTITDVISSPTSNVVVRTRFPAATRSDVYIFHELVNPGVTISGTSPSPAMDVSTGWHGAAQIIVTTVGATVQGFTGSTGTTGPVGPGGAGGAGHISTENGHGDPGSQGGQGGPGGDGGVGGIAFKTTIPVYLDNNSGTILRGNAGLGGPGGPGGGGGGGGGGSVQPGGKASPGTGGGRGGDGETNAGYNSGLDPFFSPGGIASGGVGGVQAPGGIGIAGTWQPSNFPVAGGPQGPTGPTGPVGTIGTAVDGTSKVKYINTGTITGPQVN